jgi:hypothetical protein
MATKQPITGECTFKEEKQLIFLDLAYDPAKLEYLITLPPQRFDFQSMKSLTLVQWAVEGVNFTTNGQNDVTGPLYFQLKFSGDFECSMTNNIGSWNMVQVPMESLGGWPAGQLAGGGGIPLPVRKRQQQVGRFSVAVYGPGSMPALLVFSNICLWLLVTYTRPLGSTEEFSV